MAGVEAFANQTSAFDLRVGGDGADKNRKSSGVYVQRVDTRFYSD